MNIVTGPNIKTVNTGNLPAGLYVLNAIVNDEILKTKFSRSRQSVNF